METYLGYWELVLCLVDNAGAGKYRPALRVFTSFPLKYVETIKGNTRQENAVSISGDTYWLSLASLASPYCSQYLHFSDCHSFIFLTIISCIPLYGT